MKILVAGAGGFTGRHLIKALLGAGHSVLAVVRPGSASVPQDSESLTVVPADLANLAARDLPEFEAAVHIAQANVAFPNGAAELASVNVMSAVAIAQKAVDCGATRLIYASSGSVYGFGEAPFDESAPLLGTGFYSETKKAAERLLAEFRGSLSVDLLRIFNPYGPGQQPFRLLPDIVRRVKEGRPVTVRANGSPFLSPIHVGDVVSSIISRLQAGDSQTFNISGSEIVSIREIAEIAASILSANVMFEENPQPQDGGMAGKNNLMRQLTGVEPRTLRDGLGDLIQSLAT